LLLASFPGLPLASIFTSVYPMATLDLYAAR
jgi:hypothetical protein